MKKRIASFAVLAAASTAVADTVYWDPTNGAGAGTGSATPTGTWISASTNAASWGTDANGNNPTVAQWNNASIGGDTAVFAAGTDATGTYAVAGGGAVTVAGITMEEGTQVTVSGQTAWTFAGPGSSLAVNVQTGTLVLNGQYTGSLITKTGPGVLNSASSQNGPANFASTGKWVCTQGSINFRQDGSIGLQSNPLVADEITLSSGGKLRSPLITPVTTYGANRGITLGVGGGGFDTPIDMTGTPTPLTSIWNGPITGTSGGDFQMTGAGTVVLTNISITNPNNWDGGTTISAGFLRVGASGVIPDTSVVTQTGGTLDLATNATSETVKSIAGTAGTISLTSTSTLTLANPAGEVAAQTLNVATSGKIIKNGTGALTLSGGSANNNATTGFNGEFVLNDGTLGIGTSTMLGGANTPTATFTINGGRLSNTDATDKNFNAALITNLNGDFEVGTNLFATPGIIRFNGGTQTIRNSNRTITVNGFANLQFAGVVTEDVAGRSLTKEGTGILQLTSPTNSYTGGTFVNNGTLFVTRLWENNPVTINAGLVKVAESSPKLSDGFPSGNNADISRPGSMISIANDGGALGSRVYNGTLDLTNNDLVIDYSGATPLADVRDMIRSGYNGGNWKGTGITSSTAADPAAFGNFALGYADNSALVNKYGDGTGDGSPAAGNAGHGPLFFGQSVDLTTVLVKFTHRVDLNLDGFITSNDASIFNGSYNEGQPATWSTGDLNYNGVFDTNDASIFNGAYNEALASLPEPAGLSVLGLLATGIVRRSRKQGK